LFCPETVPQVTDAGGNVDLNSTHILSSKSLSEYLSGNTKFFGKKISIEMNTMDVRDALRFITEESGVNMIIADDVKGNISLKLRQVPWDQALVMVMKTRGLGYSRQGNVLRITTLDALKKEEDDATALAKARRGVEPLKVRMYQISYADIPELEKKVAGFLSERGKAVGDVRTSSLVVTDIEDNLERVAKLLTSLDTQPQQVLIESKIVEAKEAFTRTLGVNWSLTPQAINVGNGSIRPGFASQPMDLSGGMFSFNLGVGVLDVLGTLNSTLALSEQEEKVKVISSPRILTLSNESASINQTTEVPVKSVSNQNGISTTSFSFKPLSLKLDVMPQITSDSSIIMKVGVKREFRGATIDPE
jgi:type IV pilus assembly protein PilQ